MQRDKISSSETQEKGDFSKKAPSINDFRDLRLKEKMGFFFNKTIPSLTVWSSINALRQNHSKLYIDLNLVFFFI